MANLDKVAALADTSHLDDFDGKTVERTSIAVTNAGDGLSAALAVAPRQLHHEQEVVIVLRGVVSKVGFTPLSKDTPHLLVRSHTIRAGSAVLLDSDQASVVEDYLTAEEERIKIAVEKAEGVFRLDDPEVLQDAGPGTPEDPEDPLVPDDEGGDDEPEEPTRIGARNIGVEKRGDGWHVVNKDDGTSMSGPHPSRAAAREAREREVGA